MINTNVKNIIFNFQLQFSELIKIKTSSLLKWFHLFSISNYFKAAITLSTVSISDFDAFGLFFTLLANSKAFCLLPRL